MYKYIHAYVYMHVCREADNCVYLNLVRKIILHEENRKQPLKGCKHLLPLFYSIN